MDSQNKKYFISDGTQSRGAGGGSPLTVSQVEEYPTGVRGQQPPVRIIKTDSIRLVGLA